ncbi:MAG: DUF5668 domain-containing protein [Acidobacteriota bacterium]|nr:DUF5668 domain-containing protein [Acidobacteriota bacterium]
MYMRNRIVGPVAMITVGVLFLLDGFTPYGFHRTWPIILIAIGAALVMQRAAGNDPGPRAETPSATGPDTTSEKR